MLLAKHIRHYERQQCQYHSDCDIAGQIGTARKITINPTRFITGIKKKRARR